MGWGRFLRDWKEVYMMGMEGSVYDGEWGWSEFYE